MYQSLKKRSEGFTIIEVLIVLAIAGLIMLIVFLAVPALQRNSRNNARNNDASRVVAAVQECLNNRNKVWTSCNTDAQIDQGNMSQLTGGLTFGLGAVGATYNQGNAHVGIGATCDAAGATIVTGGSSFAVSYQIEPDVNRCLQG